MSHQRRGVADYTKKITEMHVQMFHYNLMYICMHCLYDNEICLPVFLSSAPRVLDTSATEVLIPFAFVAYKTSMNEVPFNKSCTRNVGLSDDGMFPLSNSLFELYSSRWNDCSKPPS